MPEDHPLRRDLRKVAEACGVEHPGLIDTSAVEILTGRTASRPLDEVYGYEAGWGLPSAADQTVIVRLMTAEAPQGGQRAAVTDRGRLSGERSAGPAGGRAGPWPAFADGCAAPRAR